MVKNDSQVTPSLHRGNIAIILIIIIAWLLHFCFYVDEEFDIHASFWTLIFLLHLALLVGIATYCKYILPIAVSFFIGNYYAVWDFINMANLGGGSMYLYERSMYGGWQWKSNPYDFGNGLTYKLLNSDPCHSIINPSAPLDASTFCNYWGVITDQYFISFEFMQRALLVSILMSLIWWLCSHRLIEGIKNFWTNENPDKNLRTILVLILAFTMSIPYWIFFVYSSELF